MTDKQVEEVREWIALTLAKDSGFFDSRGWDYLSESAQEVFGEKADQILAHPKLAILDDDQELPDGGFYETTAMYSEAVRILLKANFRRIIPREETE